MDHLARKVARAKWTSKPGMDPDDIRADAITIDLKTEGDTLSTWECDADPNDLEQAVLALAAAGTTIDTMDIVIIRKDELEALGLEMERTAGRTAATSLQARHLDLVNIEMHRLCKLATLVANQVRSSTSCYRFKRSRVKAILTAALTAGQLDTSLLHQKILEELQ
jgi:hypothetical protein